MLRACPDSGTLRTNFRIEVGRKQRTSDATASLDKARNARRQCRLIGPKAPSSRALSSSTSAPLVPTGDGQAPLMSQLLAQFAATGLPPAYLELEEKLTTPPSRPPQPQANP